MYSPQEWPWSKPNKVLLKGLSIHKLKVAQRKTLFHSSSWGMNWETLTFPSSVNLPTASPVWAPSNPYARQGTTCLCFCLWRSPDSWGSSRTWCMTMDTVFYAEHSNHGGFYPDGRTQLFTKWGTAGSRPEQVENSSLVSFSFSLRGSHCPRDCCTLNCAVKQLPEKRSAVSSLRLQGGCLIAVDWDKCFREGQLCAWIPPTREDTELKSPLLSTYSNSHNKFPQWGSLCSVLKKVEMPNQHPGFSSCSLK